MFQIQFERYDLLRILNVHCLQENHKAIQLFCCLSQNIISPILPWGLVRQANSGCMFLSTL